MVRRLLLVIWLASLSGCASAELGRDQDNLRTTLLDLYTDQLMENLVRAYNGMPIIQMDYANATATVTCKESGSFGDTTASTHSGVATLATKTFVAGCPDWKSPPAGF